MEPFYSVSIRLSFVVYLSVCMYPPSLFPWLPPRTTAAMYSVMIISLKVLHVLLMMYFPLHTVYFGDVGSLYLSESI